jgi:hypothetical protein
MNVFQKLNSAQCLYAAQHEKAVTESPVGADSPKGLGLEIKDGPIVKTP